MPGDSAIKRNQQIVANGLLAHLDSSMFTSLRDSSEETQSFRGHLLRVLALCCVDGTADITGLHNTFKFLHALMFVLLLIIVVR